MTFASVTLLEKGSGVMQGLGWWGVRALRSERAMDSVYDRDMVYTTEIWFVQQRYGLYNRKAVRGEGTAFTGVMYGLYIREMCV